jgi:hypothetical protein
MRASQPFFSQVSIQARKFSTAIYLLPPVQIPNFNPAKRGTKFQINPKHQTPNEKTKKSEFQILNLEIGAYWGYEIWDL